MVSLILSKYATREHIQQSLLEGRWLASVTNNYHCTHQIMYIRYQNNDIAVGYILIILCTLKLTCGHSLNRAIYKKKKKLYIYTI